MPNKQYITEAQIAEEAKKAREQAGKTKSEAARDFGVSFASIHQAEDEPTRSLFELRRKMLERYANHTLEGPYYLMKKTEK